MVFKENVALIREKVVVVLGFGPGPGKGVRVFLPLFTAKPLDP